MTPDTLRNRILTKHPNSARQLDRIPDHLLTEFRRSLDHGTDPVWAEMATVRSGPRLHTETTYAARHGTLLEQFGGDKKILARRVKAWAKKGVHVTGNEVWLPHLANAPDDVEALASPGDVLAHQKRLAEKRGIALEGAVNVKGRDPEPKKAVALAPDIVTRIAKEEAKRDPSFLESRKRKLDKYEQIVERHSLKID